MQPDIMIGDGEFFKPIVVENHVKHTAKVMTEGNIEMPIGLSFDPQFMKKFANDIDNADALTKVNYTTQPTYQIVDPVTFTHEFIKSKDLNQLASELMQKKE